MPKQDETHLTKEFAIGVGETPPKHTGMHMLTGEGKELINELRTQNKLLEKQTLLWQRIATYAAIVSVIAAIAVPLLIAFFVPIELDVSVVIPP